MNSIWLSISAALQQLEIYKAQHLLKTYPVSTALLGMGEQMGSYQTPRGLHEIRAQIGKDALLNTVFIRRRLTGDIYSRDLAIQYPGRDWILTRILWLRGLEVGKNRLGKCDTMRRFIYIHGTSDENSIGKPSSRGCIRMRNQDIIELFNMVEPGTKVQINE